MPLIYYSVLNPINLLFSEADNRDARLETIADYVATNFAANNKIDVLLLQEVVNGILVGTENSARDLRSILFKKHKLLHYNQHTAFEIGLPGLLSMGNAVLSRCEIVFSLAKRLPRTAEIELARQSMKLSRNVLLTRIKLPDVGNVNFYTTHLCASCEVFERENQVNELLEFIHYMEQNTPGNVRSVLGGDFISTGSMTIESNAFCTKRLSAKVFMMPMPTLWLLHQMAARH